MKDTMDVIDHIFRAYDIRGVWDRELTEESVRKIALASAVFYKDRGVKEVVIGRDNRKSSPLIESIFVDVFGSAGIDVYLLGMVPTPVLYYALFRLSPCGLMITGSHNPPDHNGMKICYNKRTLTGEEMREIRLHYGKVDEKIKDKKGKIVDRSEYILSRYINDLIDSLNIDKIKGKYVFDTGNGTVGPVLSRLLELVGAEYISLYFEPDSSFPYHHPDPTLPDTLVAMKKSIQMENLGGGFAFDGDGDRIGVVDETGDILWGDEILAALAEEILYENPGSTIIGEVKCSDRMFEFIKDRGGRPIMWKTGHSFIKKKMEESKALLAGEMSGHIYIKDRYFGFDDAIYAAMRLIEIAETKGTNLSSLRVLGKGYTTPEIRIDVRDDSTKFEIVKRCIKYYLNRGEDVDIIDGVRFSRKDGWALIRASNTQPQIILRAEGRDNLSMEILKKEIMGLVERIKKEVEGY